MKLCLSVVHLQAIVFFRHARLCSARALAQHLHGKRELPVVEDDGGWLVLLVLLRVPRCKKHIALTWLFLERGELVTGGLLLVALCWWHCVGGTVLVALCWWHCVGERRASDLDIARQCQTWI